MSRAWVLVRGGIRPPSVVPGTAPDARRQRRSPGKWPRPWVSRATRWEIRDRLDRGESVEQVAEALGLQPFTVQSAAIELD